MRFASECSLASKRSKVQILQICNFSIFNYPTRGFTDTYSLQGYLVKKDTNIRPPTQETDFNQSNELTKNNTILKLFGRQVYPNSNEYEYYVMVNTGYNDNIKYFLEKQKRELYDGDNVYVDILKQNYKVEMLKDRTFRYNPYLV